MASVVIDFANIQGNAFGGFNKDFQTFLFLEFATPTLGRAWIKEVSDAGFGAGVATSSSAQVLKFNGEFKALKAKGLKPENFLEVAWTNLGLTFAGMKALNLNTAGINSFPQAFRQGMAARSAAIGDVGASDPSHWTAPFHPAANIHAVLLVAADTAALLADRLSSLKTAAFSAGVTIIQTVVEGRTRLGKESGHEHFGFKDGVSQPGIRGVDLPDDPIGNPDQGHPGQDLLWPGEFVLGYPTQIAHADPAVDGPNPNPGPISTSGPSWTRDGSYLVFRRLNQDVPGFEHQVSALALSTGLSVDMMGAKIVGRFKSGCPLETRAFASSAASPAVDPGIAQPALGNDDSLNLNFEFGDDVDGAVCPLASHIRKAYPRNEQTLAAAANSESNTQTHRLLRRGIAFGGSIGDPVGGQVTDPRGLLFLCYQKSIETQFEFVHSSWVNDANFPAFPQNRPTSGQDPLISQTPQGPFQLDAAQGAITVKHFVTTTGGEYFFTPSIRALREIGAGQH